MATIKKQSGEARKELTASIDAIAKRSGISRDKAITAWYAVTIFGIDEDEAIDAASVDGSEDNGCDFIYIDEDAETVYVLQGYVSDRADRSASKKKWDAVTAAIANLKDPESFRHGGRADIADKFEGIDVESFSIVLGVVTLAAKSDQIDRACDTANRTKAYGENVSFFYEHQDGLFDKYLIAKATERSVPLDTIEFVGQVAEVKGEFGQALVGTVPASELVRLHGKHQNTLFEGNVRLFIGERKGGINEKIIETAKERPGIFWALNNGITIVAERFEGITEQKFQLTQFSIVNGCQTTVSLSKVGLNSKALVLVRIVGAKKTLVTEIVRYNNTQNPVKLSAVRLLDPVQESLRLRFSEIDFKYAPKQEGARSPKTANRIDLEKITQFLASASEATVLDAVSKKAELFDKHYKSLFPRGLSAEFVYLYWLLGTAVEKERTALLEDQEDGDDAVMRAILGIHGTPWGIYVCAHLVNRVGTDFTKLSLEKMTRDEFKNAIAKYAKLALELYTDIAVNILSADEESNASPRNQVRVRSFLDKLKRNLSLRGSKIDARKLPKLQAVVASLK